LAFGSDVTHTEATYEVRTRSKAKYDVRKRPKGVNVRTEKAWTGMWKEFQHFEI
jgi:hypothetical protein